MVKWAEFFVPPGVCCWRAADSLAPDPVKGLGSACSVVLSLGGATGLLPLSSCLSGLRAQTTNVLHRNSRWYRNIGISVWSYMYCVGGGIICHRAPWAVISMWIGRALGKCGVTRVKYYVALKKMRQVSMRCWNDDHSCILMRLQYSVVI